MTQNFNQFTIEINDYLANEFEIEGQIAPEMTITEALDLDSLDLLDLVVAVEQKYGVKINGDDFHTIKTMNDFHTHVFSKILN